MTRIHVEGGRSGRALLAVVRSDTVEISNHALGAVESVDQVMPVAIVDRASVAVSSDTACPGIVIKRERPAAVDASTAARPQTAVGGGEGEPGVKGGVDGVGEEG